MLESTVEACLVKEVKRVNGVALKLVCLSVTGMPDRTVLMPDGKIYFVELKAPGRKTFRRQNVMHRMLTRFGFRVYILDTKEKIRGFINEIRTA